MPKYAKYAKYYEIQSLDKSASDLVNIVQNLIQSGDLQITKDAWKEIEQNYIKISEYIEDFNYQKEIIRSEGYDDGYDNGYDDGRESGYQDGYADAKSIYDESDQ